MIDYQVGKSLFKWTHFLVKLLCSVTGGPVQSLCVRSLIVVIRQCHPQNKPCCQHLQCWRKKQRKKQFIYCLRFKKKRYYFLIVKYRNHKKLIQTRQKKQKKTPINFLKRKKLLKKQVLLKTSQKTTKKAQSRRKRGTRQKKARVVRFPSQQDLVRFTRLSLCLWGVLPLTYQELILLLWVDHEIVKELFLFKSRKNRTIKWKKN